MPIIYTHERDAAYKRGELCDCGKRATTDRLAGYFAPSALSRVILLCEDCAREGGEEIA